MVGKETLRAGCKLAKPVLSTNYSEAHRRVMSLYRAYYRYIPYIVKHFDIPKNEENCREKIREYFYRNACVTDLRVIDILVIKTSRPLEKPLSLEQPDWEAPQSYIAYHQGFINLKEMTHMWQQKGHVMAHWHPTYEPKPCDFVGKFLANLD